MLYILCRKYTNTLTLSNDEIQRAGSLWNPRNSGNLETQGAKTKGIPHHYSKHETSTTDQSKEKNWLLIHPGEQAY